LEYDAVVTKKSLNFDVTCPCCGAVLKVDSETEAIISHTAPVKPKTFADIEAAARAMKEQDSRRDSIFRQSVEAQKHASDLLEKKFQEAVKKAKESPDTGKPVRDWDLE
jgi:Zn-finger nucleic acid-binding protein